MYEGLYIDFTDVSIYIGGNCKIRHVSITDDNYWSYREKRSVVWNLYFSWCIL